MTEGLSHEQVLILPLPERLSHGFASSERHGAGLCAGIAFLLSPEEHNKVQTWMRDWSEFSGSNGYPVPSPDSRKGPEWAYYALGRWIGPYGEARRRLATYLVARAVKEERAGQ